jgi:triacylglycerol lipase
MSTLAGFLRPDGFEAPHPSAVLQEGRVLLEAGRHLLRVGSEARSRAAVSTVERVPPRGGDPVVLVPGFLAGDASLAALARGLRADGYRTYRSRIHVNVGCTWAATRQLEARIESIAIRRDTRVQVVGHSLGGLLARSLAVRRPDLVSGIVTLGSPLLAPAAHHLGLTAMVEVLNRLSRAGVPGLMAEDCVAGDCARRSFAEASEPVPAGTAFTSVWSPYDGIVDPRSCLDPEARAVEVATSHCGMALDPAVRDVVARALRPAEAGPSDPGDRDGGGPEPSVLVVDGGVGA